MERKIKKWIVAVFAAAACLAAVVCAPGVGGAPGAGGTEEARKKAPKAGAVSETAAFEEAPLKIGVSIYRYSDDFMDLYRKELKKYLEESCGARVVMRDAGGDQIRQNRQVQEFLEQGCDAVIINLVKVGEAERVAGMCGKAGVPLVFINREPREAQLERWKAEGMAVSYVGTDSIQCGTYQGEIILETPNKGDFNGDGVISYAMICGDSENTDTKYRTEYSVLALENGGMKTEKLFQWSGNWETEQGRKLAAQALLLHRDRLEVILCNNDAMANGAWESIDQAGRTVGEDILLVGVDALEKTVRYVKEGKVTGTVLNDYSGQAHLAADTAMKLIRGGKVEAKYTVDYIKITTEDALDAGGKRAGTLEK